MFWGAICSVCGAATIIVDRNGGADFTQVQPAIDAAADGDTVVVRAGEYVITESVTFRGKAIGVKAERGPEETTVRMADAPANPDRASVVIFEDGEGEASVLEGFTLTGGKGTKWGQIIGGGGVLCITDKEETVLEGTVFGLRTGSFLSELIVTGGTSPWGGFS